ncbi:MAG: phosphodiester glycosidase family protein [Gemmatimonadales bacterium]|nr:phosphodiester glycosidase family protein [Gemmatimonadales bacterium]
MHAGMLRLALTLLALPLGPRAASPGITWAAARDGIERTEFAMAERGVLQAVQVIALRIDPARIQLDLMARTRYAGLRGAWTVDSMPAEAVLALNAGQFREGTPWGWLVQDGVERQAPGTGSVAMAVVFDAGAVRLLTPEEIPAARGTVRAAIQSYPMLLVDGVMPPPLRAPGRGVDLEHRDTRLAIGTDAEGRVLLVLTRFRGAGSAGATLPFGPTIPELASLMRRLGATRAVGLDGGLSSQLALRESSTTLRQWSNWRMVPLGIVGVEVNGER